MKKACIFFMILILPAYAEGFSFLDNVSVMSLEEYPDTNFRFNDDPIVDNSVLDKYNAEQEIFGYLFFSIISNYSGSSYTRGR